MSLKTIYLDNNATTAMDPRVVSTMVEVMQAGACNASSVHAHGRSAQGLLVDSRRIISSYLGIKPRELIFTSGGTEGANLFIRGFCMTEKKGRILTSEVEHSAVYKTVQAMQLTGWEVDYIPVGAFGAASVEAVAEAMRPDTKLIALMAVNNETGVRSDVEGIAKLAAASGVALFVDGVAWLGKEDFNLPAGVSGATFSGHKFHGPLGIGLLALKQMVHPLITGGDQEFGRRAGTENLPGIVGLAKAIELLREAGSTAIERMRQLRDYFEAGIERELGSIEVNGSGPRICNTSNLAFEGVDGESLLIALDQAGVSASHGSACASGALEPSRILFKMGFSLERINSSLRFSVSRATTQDEVEKAVHIVSREAKRLRIISSGS